MMSKPSMKLSLTKACMDHYSCHQVMLWPIFTLLTLQAVMNHSETCHKVSWSSKQVSLLHAQWSCLWMPHCGHQRATVVTAAVCRWLPRGGRGRSGIWNCCGGMFLKDCGLDDTFVTWNKLIIVLVVSNIYMYEILNSIFF